MSLLTHDLDEVGEVSSTKAIDEATHQKERHFEKESHHCSDQTEGIENEKAINQPSFELTSFVDLRR